MKFALVIAAAASLVAAQDFSGQPACAIPCLTENIPKVGCALTDTACQCSSATQTALLPIVAPCLIGACSADDLIKSQQAAAAVCAALSSASPSSTSSVASSTSAAAATTTTVSSTSTTTVPPPSTTTSPAPASVSTAAAGHMAVGGALAMVLGAVAAL